MLIFFLACAPEIQLSASTEPCENADLSNLPEAVLDSEITGSTGKVWLDNYVQPAGLIFDPTFDFDKRVVLVYAAWTGTAGDADFCYQPTVEMSGLKGKFEIRWYESLEDASPYDTINIEAD